MIATKAVFAAQYLAAVALASLTWFLAQASTLDTVERFVGGIGVASAAVVIVYLTLRFSQTQRVSWNDLLDNAREDAVDARQALTAEQTRARQAEVELQKRCDDLQSCLDQERSLRIALEERGLKDRRRTLEDREGT